MLCVEEFDLEGREFNHVANTGCFCTPGLTQRDFNEGECQTELSFSIIRILKKGQTSLPRVGINLQAHRVNQEGEEVKTQN